MSDYLDKIQTQKKDGTPISTVLFQDSAAREDITEIQNELTTDTTTIEGNPLNFTTLSAQTAKSTILSVEPIQDLHGYDKPWVGGAGKNLFDEANTSLIGFSNNNGTFTNTLTDSYTTFVFRVDARKNGTIVINSNTVVISQPGRYYVAIKIDALFDTIRIKHNGQTQDMSINMPFSTQGTYTISLDVVSVNPNTVGGLVIKNIQIESGSTATTYEPYSNLCPISGRSEIGILGLGRNQCNVLCGDFSHGGITFTNNGNGTFELHGTSTTAVDFRINQLTRTGKDHLTTYFVNNVYTCQTYTDKFKVRIMQDQTWASVFDTGYSANPVTQTISETKDNCFILVTIPTGKTFDHETFKIMLELGSDASSWEKSQDLTISFGQTVYGGTLDVENGVLSVINVSETFDGSSDEAISVVSEATGLIPWRIVAKIANDSMTWTNQKEVTGKLWSDKFAENVNSDNTVTPNKGTYYGDIGIHYRVDGSHNVIIAPQDNSVTDEASARTWLSNNPTQICYTLATPVTINLTPHTINLLKGVNNISTDGDKITLTYRDGSVATLEDVKLTSEDLEKQIADAQILTDTVTGDKYILVVTNGVLSIEQVSN